MTAPGATEACDLPPAIVSLTAIRSRTRQLDRVIGSLLAQSVPPARVILSVSEEPYRLDTGIGLEALPPSLLAWAIEGRLDILFVKNTGPYRKLVPALRRYAGQEMLVATADDDTIYPPHWLAGLLSAYRRHRCVIAYRCRAMRVDQGRFASYSRWGLVRGAPRETNYGEVPRHLRPLFTLPTGVHGVLYNTRFFPDLDLLDRLQALAPLQDDLAFKAATFCAGIGVATVDPPGEGTSPPHFGSAAIDGETLYQLNRSENDDAWQGIVKLLEAEGRLSLGRLLSQPAPT